MIILDKLVRVCEWMCEMGWIFMVNVKRKPFGVQIEPLYGKTDDIGGILIIGVKDKGCGE